MQKINVLFYNSDVHGVNYYRTLKPALQIQKEFGDQVEVEINPNVDWNNTEYLKKFNIIHGHRTFCNFEQMPQLVAHLKSLGIITILDVDDYWDVNNDHPLKDRIKADGLAQKIVQNLKMVDYVSTTTPVYADYIKPHNKNVLVFENAIDATEGQWKFEGKKESPYTRIMWLGGSSHETDLTLLKDSFHKLKDDATVKGKYQLHLTGFDLRGNTTEMRLNENLITDLGKRWTREMHQQLIKVRFNLDLLSDKVMPVELKNKYRGQALLSTTRDILPTESVWHRYEKDIFTSNYGLITDPAYKAYLDTFDLDNEFPNALEEQPYIRHKTQGVYSFANNYRHADVCLAPIRVFGKIKGGKFEDNVNNRYQFAKSNLKIIEAAFHKVPVIASNIPIYNYDKEFVDGKNILFVNPERQEKDWFKKMKQLIGNPGLIKDMGEAAYEVVKDKYSLSTIAKKRVAAYQEMMLKK